jgi:putative membrane protein
MTSFMAFLHHIAAFALVAAGVVLAVGLLRVFYFEKGAAYYFHSGTFIAKLALFALVGLLSIYPTRKFIAWRKAIDASSVPAIRRIIHLELVAVVLILLMAALMADGIGYLG